MTRVIIFHAPRLRRRAHRGIHAWRLALYEETREIKDGHLVLPQKPGLGLKFDEKAIASFRA